MKYLPMKHAPKAAAARKPGYLEACLKRGQIVTIRGEQYLQMSEASFEALRREFSFDGRGLGDLVEKLAKPVAKALKRPCIKQDGTLRPESACAKRRRLLNKLVPSLPFFT